MGCDIHLDVELRQDDGSWAPAPPPPLANIGSYQYQPDHYDGRNYVLFAALADVRNRGGIEPIHLPRGLPADVSDAHAERATEYGIDGHSHSWHTLRHLLDYDWDVANGGAHTVGEDFPRLMLRMWRWSDGRPDDVRIVFFFDN